MPYRRMTYRPRTFVPRRRKYQWVRGQNINTSPVQQPNTNTFDMLSFWRVEQGILLNLPDIVIWRIHLKISARISLAPNTVNASSGVHVAAFVDDVQPTSFNPVTAEFNQKYLIWEELYAYQTLVGTGQPIVTQPGPLALYKEFDVKSHRKILNIEQSLLLTIGAQGNANLDEYSLTYSVLVKLP